MMAETTPGPWTHSGRKVYAPGENGGNVCEVSEPRGSDYVEHVPVELGSKDREEAYANARLIAASPELLEACKYALTFHENPRKIRTQLWDLLAGAIEKAEGHL